MGFEKESKKWGKKWLVGRYDHFPFFKAEAFIRD
jgi:hypothetical protein